MDNGTRHRTSQHRDHQHFRRERVISLALLLGLLLRFRPVRGRLLAQEGSMKAKGCGGEHKAVCGTLGQWCCCQTSAGGRRRAVQLP